MHKGFQTYWRKLKRRWWMCIALSICLKLFFSLSFLIIVVNLFHLNLPAEFLMVYILSLLAIILLWSAELLPSNQKIIHQMHEQFPELEYSLQLLSISELNPVESIQQAKIYSKLPQIQSIKSPFKGKPYIYGLILTTLALVASTRVSLFSPAMVQPDALKAEYQIIDSVLETSEWGKFGYQIKVYPPAYTNMRSFVWQPDTKVPEGSQLNLSSFGLPAAAVTWQNTDTIDLKPAEVFKRTIRNSSVFQWHFQLKDSTHSDSLRIIAVKLDQKPQVSTNLKENRYRIEWQEIDESFDFKVDLQDDYGISSANMVMTLSRGDGEAVKFREMKQPLQRIYTGRKQQQTAYRLQLDTLGLEPGDELYFYLEAFDNKTPISQSGKTDVYFLEIADTAMLESVAFEGLALSTEAEYFKSQRQIIIDTEKLLKEQKKISRKDFENRSNNIGADQKVLRLRYGVFLGEEFESTGGMGVIDHTGHDHGDLEAGEDEGHDHEEHANESNFSNPIYNETPELEAYVHAHDESETATFFDAAVKAKLKEALANMWEAELYLRIHEPQKAIPYEYAALKLIKEVQQSSRIYVQRMGFEPPPLEPDKRRLSGDLDKIKAQKVQNESELNFQDKIQFNLSNLTRYERMQDFRQAKAELKDLAATLVKEMTIYPVRYAQLLALIKNYQSKADQKVLQQIIVELERISSLQSIEAYYGESPNLNLHELYFQGLNE